MKNTLLTLLMMVALVQIAGCGKRGRLFTPGTEEPHHYPGKEPLCPGCGA